MSYLLGIDFFIFVLYTLCTFVYVDVYTLNNAVMRLSRFCVRVYVFLKFSYAREIIYYFYYFYLYNRVC